jgi:hypothetical protein
MHSVWSFGKFLHVHFAIVCCFCSGFWVSSVVFLLQDFGLAVLVFATYG